MIEKFLIGTYTKRTSQGIYEVTVDTKRGEITFVKPYISVHNPTYLATKDDLLMSVCTRETIGGVADFNIADQAHPVVNNEIILPGAAPCYVSFDPKRNLAYSANYHTGVLVIYEVQADGTLNVSQKIKHTGHGPRPEQQAAHLHYAHVTPDERLAVCDLGSDKVYTYDINDDNHAVLKATLTLPAGFGPRHLVFTKDGQHAYVVGELSSQVALLNYNDQTGQFELGQILSTIPETHTGTNGAAAIKLSPDDRFLYVSNRGHNSIAVYRISADHTLDLAQYTDTAGSFPRDFEISEDGNFVLVANQTSDNLALFRRDQKLGFLELLQNNVTVPEGVCVMNYK